MGGSLQLPGGIRVTVPNCTSYVVSKLEPGTWEVQGECLRDQSQHKPGRFSDLRWGMTPLHVTPVLGLGLPGQPHWSPQTWPRPERLPTCRPPTHRDALNGLCCDSGVWWGNHPRGLQVTRGNRPLILHNPRQCFLDWTLKSRSQTPPRAVSFDF